MNATMNMTIPTFLPKVLTCEEVAREIGVIKAHLALAHTFMAHAGLELEGKDYEPSLVTALRGLLATAGDALPHPWGRVDPGVMSDGFRATVREAIRKRIA